MTLDVTNIVASLILVLLVSLVLWRVSVHQNNVGLVDIGWPVFFWLSMTLFFFSNPDPGTVARIGFALTSVWALRLALHLAIRNRGQPEDRRYREIRQRFEPGFKWKSLFIVFWFQSILAWMLATPLYVAVGSQSDVGLIAISAIFLWSIGFMFETIADLQLFKHQKITRGRNSVLSTGLWRYTRHPNYFGEFCIVWSFFLLALSSSGWWTIFAPVAMTYSLFHFSGIARMETNIEERRPGYKEYASRTNAFFPWARRSIDE